MDFSFSELIFNSVETLPGFETRAAFSVNSITFFEKMLTRCHNVDDIVSSVPWRQLQGEIANSFHADNYHLLPLDFGLCIYLCHYRSKADRMMNRLRRCRHEMSGFHRSRAGVQPREDCAVIHRPAPTAQTVR